MMVAQIYIHGTDGPCIFNYTAFKLRVYERTQNDTAAAWMGQLSMFTRGVSTICVA